MSNYPNYNSNQFTDQMNINTEPNNLLNNLQNNLQNNLSNNLTNNLSNNLPNNLSNTNFENLGNFGNDMDTISIGSNHLNGTSLNDLSGGGINKYEDNNSLIKSLTKEIISNLRENNIDLYDNMSKKSSNYDIDNESYNDSESENNYKKKKKKKNKEKTLKEDVQDYIEKSNPLPSTNNYIPSIFDDYFNYKDFLVLFILYFILSQDMIKDFFARYFSSLNPDDEGKVNIQGVIIYGLILTVLFIIIRKLV